MLIRLLAAAAVAAISLAGPALADATIPAKDIAGAKDTALVKRYDGSLIVSFERKAFTDFTIPLAKIEVNKEGERDAAHNNYIFRPAKQLEVEGAMTRLVYLAPQDRSPLEVLRNYQDEVEAAGGEVLFQCKGAQGCGGDATRASYGGGGDMSFMMLLLDQNDIKDESFSNGSCALTSQITDQRYFAAKMPAREGGDAHVSVFAYQIKDGGNYCKTFNGRTFTLVQIVEPKSREKKMVTVNAAEMAKSIDATGRIALYGIFFDTDKAVLKPESDPTVAEIAALLGSSPKLAVLIVGHTDNQGAFDYNVDLSKRRADAVVKALVSGYRIDAKRLKAAGAGMIAPAAPNEDETGRAKNRRVEIVKLN